MQLSLFSTESGQYRSPQMVQPIQARIQVLLRSQTETLALLQGSKTIDMKNYQEKIDEKHQWP